MTTTTFRPSTARQQAFLDKLLGEKSVEVETLEAIALQRVEGMSTRQASGWIDYLLAQPRRAASATSATVTEDGMYQTPEGVIFKVQIAKQGSGNLYAKRLDTDTLSFVYAPGALRDLTPAMKMSLEAAQAFGRLYGVCCQCGRDLTDEDSIAAGIGPVCAGKF